MDDANDTTLAETENFIVWRSQEESGAVIHLELGAVSLHLAADEWNELVILIKSAD